MNTEIASTADRPQGPLLSVGQLAELLNCSSRHCYRLADAGRLPRPVKLGSLVRWRSAEIADWIAAGCPANWRGGQP